MISIHGIKDVTATKSELPGGNWTELHFESGMGELCHITLYFESIDLASAFHDMINNLPTQRNIDKHLDTIASLTTEHNQ